MTDGGLQKNQSDETERRSTLLWYSQSRYAKVDPANFTLKLAAMSLGILVIRVSLEKLTVWLKNRGKDECLPMQMSQQEIDQVKKEIEDFKAKSMQNVASAPALSAHYHRLYMASKDSLKRFDRIARSLEDKHYREQRKNGRKGGTQPAPGANNAKNS